MIGSEYMDALSKGLAWVATSVAVIVAIKVTGDASCLLAFLFPLFLEI